MAHSFRVHGSILNSLCRVLHYSCILMNLVFVCPPTMKLKPPTHVTFSCCTFGDVIKAIECRRMSLALTFTSLSTSIATVHQTFTHPEDRSVRG